MITKILSRLIYILAKFLHMSYRYQAFGEKNKVKAQETSEAKTYILGVWHQNLIGALFGESRTGSYVVMASRSKDSEPVAYTCRNLGHKVVRGSSTRKGGPNKGGKEAKAEMINLLRSGFPGAVTVDGPKGPEKEVKYGIINMAKEVNCPIVPFFARGERNWIFNSWDKFHLPKPFTKVTLAFGPPITPTEFENSETPIEVIVKNAIDDLEKMYLAGNISNLNS